MRCVSMLLACAGTLSDRSRDARRDWIRQGNAAFARDELETALSLYEKAETDATDPGLVAFNKAAVLYRLKTIS